MDWTPHEDVARLDTKAGSLLSTVCTGHRKRRGLYPVQGFHQDIPEAERHKDRLMDITLTAERKMESNSQVVEAVFVAS